MKNQKNPQNILCFVRMLDADSFKSAFDLELYIYVLVTPFNVLQAWLR